MACESSILFSLCLILSLVVSNCDTVEKREALGFYGPESELLYGGIGQKLVPVPLSPVVEDGYHLGGPGIVGGGIVGHGIGYYPGVYGPGGYKQIISDGAQHGHLVSGGGHNLGGTVGGAVLQDSLKYIDDDRAIHDNHGAKSYVTGKAAKDLGFDEGAHFDGGNAYGAGAQDASQQSEKAGHNKGQHSSGFHTTYHKDESAKNTHFYDDEFDAGNFGDAHANDKFYNDKGAVGYHGGKHAGEFESGAHGLVGSRGEGGLIGSRSGIHDAYGKKGLVEHRAEDFSKNFGGGGYSGGEAVRGYVKAPHFGYLR